MPSNVSRFDTNARHLQQGHCSHWQCHLGGCQAKLWASEEWNARGHGHRCQCRWYCRCLRPLCKPQIASLSLFAHTLCGTFISGTERNYQSRFHQWTDFLSRIVATPKVADDVINARHTIMRLIYDSCDVLSIWRGGQCNWHVAAGSQKCSVMPVLLSNKMLLRVGQ